MNIKNNKYIKERINKNAYQNLLNSISTDGREFVESNHIEQKTEEIDGFLSFYFDTLQYNSEDVLKLGNNYNSIHKTISTFIFSNEFIKNDKVILLLKIFKFKF